ncbi:ribosomal protein S12 methylthiotransferase [Treponema bryantii]|uniref:Ribosomal protein uS12 methylthiotransferase RimO n=1 Tax=Treponema bryantii TaxID=163 RepID=A0A1I3KWI6_9SPIR|nr:30S ribosomal protein S12 methylthiotransferase RimO [Treponema bryantii]SFI76698.1 ribosomal protein S12 methylthiotransferase [Treponema bryantii]
MKFFIDQHGCAKNQTDGEILAGFLINKGYKLTMNADEADFILVNSCGFIQSAKKESIDAIYNIRKAYPEAKIILTGCLAERYAQDLIEQMPELDGVFGNGDLSKICSFMNKAKKERTAQTFSQNGVCSGERPVLFNFPGSAFVKITEGCSNHCSFCAIPLIRGEVRSRPEAEILEEIKQLLSDGVYEINLIGQDLAVYGKEFGTSLAALLKKIAKIKGDFIVRPLYIHPDHFTDDIIEAIKTSPKLLPYFDIPFQSADDKIILAMNRTGSYKEYSALVKKIHRELPSAVLRTTFLTGFPGETDEAAENTARFLQEIKPDWSGCFPYSREEDTPAYNMKPRVPAKTAKARAAHLEELQTAITTERLERYVKQEVNVLVEELISVEENSEGAANSEGLAIGRAWFQAPEVDGSVVIRYDLSDPEAVKSVVPGSVVTVKVLASTGVDLDSAYIKNYLKKSEKNERKFIF